MEHGNGKTATDDGTASRQDSGDNMTTQPEMLLVTLSDGNVLSVLAEDYTAVTKERDNLVKTAKTAATKTAEAIGYQAKTAIGIEGYLAGRGLISEPFAERTGNRSAIGIVRGQVVSDLAIRSGVKADTLKSWRQDVLNGAIRYLLDVEAEAAKVAEAEAMAKAERAFKRLKADVKADVVAWSEAVKAEAEAVKAEAVKAEARTKIEALDVKRSELVKVAGEDVFSTETRQAIEAENVADKPLSVQVAEAIGKVELLVKAAINGAIVEGDAKAVVALETANGLLAIEAERAANGLVRLAKAKAKAEAEAILNRSGVSKAEAITAKAKATRQDRAEAIGNVLCKAISA